MGWEVKPDSFNSHLKIKTDLMEPISHIPYPSPSPMCPNTGREGDKGFPQVSWANSTPVKPLRGNVLLGAITGALA
jgi:hypothetical protein